MGIITEVGKDRKVIQSNPSPPPVPTDCGPQCHISMAHKHLQGRGLPHLPEQLRHCSTALWEKKLSLISNLSPRGHKVTTETMEHPAKDAGCHRF